jgi:hypothetical protein
MIPPINIESLDGYKKTPWSKDYLLDTIDKKYKLYFYNVDEHSMGSYVGHLSIFEDNKGASKILSSGRIWIDYGQKDTFIYAPKSNCLIFRMPVYQAEINKTNYPYLLIKPDGKCFSFIDWDFTSIYYSFDEIEVNIIKVKEQNRSELDRVNYLRRTGKVINLGDLSWHDLKKFDNAREIYLGE